MRAKASASSRLWSTSSATPLNPPNPEAGVAAFDVDGVLWHGDVSEDFTRWMMAGGHFDAALWPAYQEAHRVDPARGCLQILSFYVGMTEMVPKNLGRKTIGYGAVPTAINTQKKHTVFKPKEKSSMSKGMRSAE